MYNYFNFITIVSLVVMCNTIYVSLYKRQHGALVSIYVRTYVRTYIRTYVRMYVCTYVCLPHGLRDCTLSSPSFSLFSLFLSFSPISLSSSLLSRRSLFLPLPLSFSLSLSLSLSRLYIPTVWIIYLRQLLYVTFDICSCQTKVQFSE